MSISQRAMSAVLTGLPRCGVSAAKAEDAITIQQRTSSLRIGVRNLAGAAHRPAGDHIGVMIAEGGDRRLLVQLAALGDKSRAGGLKGALVVPGAALQNCGATVPPPWQAETGEGFGLDRSLQCRFRPAFAAVGADHDFCDLAASR